MARTDVRRRRRSRLAVVLTAGMVGAAWAGPAIRALEGGSEHVPVARSTYVVQTGDTLWSIAERLSPGEDPRPVVDAIAEANEVRVGDIVPGQTLVVVGS